MLYKSLTKQSILGSRVPRGSRGRSAKSFSNTSKPLQILHKTDYFGALSAPCRPVQAPTRACSDPCMLRPVQAPTRPTSSEPCSLRPMQAPPRSGSDPCTLRPVQASTRAGSDPCGLRPVHLRPAQAPTPAGSDPCLERLMAQETDPPNPFQMLPFLYKSSAKRSILGSRAPRGPGGRPLQILHKTEHFGVSGASWLRRPIRQLLFKCFKSFTNPLQNRALWSSERLLAQEADPPNPSQMLQFLYKPFTKQSTLELRAPPGSGGRSSKSFSNALIPLQTLYKTEHFGAPSAFWLRRPIRQILLKCFNSYTTPLQKKASLSSGCFMAQEARSSKSFSNALIP